MSKTICSHFWRTCKPNFPVPQNQISLSHIVINYSISFSKYPLRDDETKFDTQFLTRLLISYKNYSTIRRIIQNFKVTSTIKGAGNTGKGST